MKRPSFKLPPHLAPAANAVLDCLAYIDGHSWSPSAQERQMQVQIVTEMKKLLPNTIFVIEQMAALAVPRNHRYDIAFTFQGHLIGICELKAKPVTAEDCRQLYGYTQRVPFVVLISRYEPTLAKELLANIPNVGFASLWQNATGARLTL